MSVVYTLEKAELVRDRARRGEFVSAVCADLGMKYENFCRWCRRNKFFVHTAATARMYRRKRGPYRIGRNPEQPGTFRPGTRTAGIVADLRRGRPLREIARRRDVALSYVRRVRFKAGLVPPRGRGRNQLLPDDRRLKFGRRRIAIEAALARGEPVSKIARKHRVSRTYVYFLRAQRTGPTGNEP